MDKPIKARIGKAVSLSEGQRAFPIYKLTVVGEVREGIDNGNLTVHEAAFVAICRNDEDGEYRFTVPSEYGEYTYTITVGSQFKTYEEFASNSDS